MEEIGRLILAKGAARKIKSWIEAKAGHVEEINELAGDGVSVIEIFLSRTSQRDKEIIRRELDSLLRRGVTPAMILKELSKKMPELAPALSKEAYFKAELQKLEELIRGK